MGALDLIDKYYPQDNELRNIFPKNSVTIHGEIFLILTHV